MRVPNPVYCLNLNPDLILNWEELGPGEFLLERSVTSLTDGNNTVLSYKASRKGFSHSMNLDIKHLYPCFNKGRGNYGLSTVMVPRAVLTPLHRFVPFPHFKTKSFNRNIRWYIKVIVHCLTCTHVLFTYFMMNLLRIWYVLNVETSPSELWRLYERILNHYFYEMSSISVCSGSQG